jgi:hypothetical protein
VAIRARFAVFAVLFGIIIILLSAFTGIDLPYNIRYLILLAAVILYVISIATFEASRRRKRPK